MQPDPIVRRFSPLLAAVEDYLLAREVEHRSAQTLRAYRQALRHFTLFAGDLDPARVDAALLRRFLRYLSERELSPRSQHNYFVAVCSCLRWLAAEEVYGVDARQLSRVKPPRVETEQVAPLTPDEVTRLFAACNTRTWTGTRLRAILAVLIDAGLRASELCGLRLADVDLTAGVLTIRASTSKARRSREIHLGYRARQELNRWWSRKRHLMELAPKSALFLGWNEQPLTARTLHRLVQRHGQRAGVLHLHPHRFRHTFAIMCFQAKMDPFTVQTLLGHSDLTMTRKYMLIADADVSEEKRAKSPLDRLKVRF